MRHRPGRSVLVACSVLLWIAAAGAQPSAEGQPAAVAVEPVKDVGTVPKGEKVSHDFVFRNDGPADLVLSEVRAGCGCTVVRFDREIAPGSTGTVQAVVDTKNFSGPIAKSVTVYTNDPRQPRIRLTVKAEVRPYVVARPGYARHMLVKGQEPGTVVQHLWAGDGHELTVEGVESPFPYLEVSFRRAEPEERLSEGPEVQWLVETTLDRDAPVGPVVGQVVVVTDHPDARQLEISVSGRVNPVLAVRPMQADFGTFAGDQPRRTALLVINYGDDPIHLRSLSSDLPSLQAELKELDPGRRYQIALRLAPDLPQGPFSGTLKIETDSSAAPVVEVGIKGTVAQGS